MLIGIKMKFQKTYKDFVNEIISEAKVGALKSNPNSFGNTIAKDVVNSVKEEKKKREQLRRKMRNFLKNYAKAFILEHESEWNNFINAIIKSTGGKTPITVTKYQFMQAFFQYYFDTVFNGKVKGVRSCLEKASESIQLEKEEYSKSMINKVYKFVKKGQKNKKLFVEVFNSLCGGGW